MKRILLFFVVCLLLLTACKQPPPLAKVTLKVVNQGGLPAANVPLVFTLSSKNITTSKTNEDGIFIGEGRTKDSYIFTIAPYKVGTTDGKYYRTKYENHIANWKNVPEDDKWKPWNETINLVVKEKINPIAMYGCMISDFKRNIPKIEEWVGYDFEQNDWLAPYGKGKVADVEFLITHNWKDQSYVQQILKLRFPYPQAGAYFMKKDIVVSRFPKKEMFSDFKSVYHADPKHDYQNEISFFREDVKTERSLINKSLNVLKEFDYLIFRTRTKVDEDGNIVEARYGKIYGPIEFNGVELTGNKYLKKRVRMSFYLNPNTNDTNLECKPYDSLCPGKLHIPEP